MRRILLLPVALMLAFASQAQEQIIYDETITESYLLRYQNSDDRSQQIINYMINEIRRFGNKNRQTDQVIFSYSQTTRISRKGKQLTSFVIIRDFRTDSKVNYRGFPLVDVLLPAKLEMDCQLLNKNNQVIAAYSVSDADFHSDKNQFTFNYTDTNNLRDLKFIVKSKEFRYTSRNKTDFNNKLSDIDRYYDVNAKMSMAFDDLSRINPNNIDLLFEYDNMIKNVYRLIDEIESYHLEQNLNLRDYDPQFVHKKLDDLRYEANRQHEIVSNTIANLYKIYYNMALEALVNGNEPLAVNLFEKSLYNNPLFAPSMLQLAKIDYKNNRIDLAASKVKDIFYSMKPDPETRLMSLELVEKIYGSYMDWGESLLNQRSYQQALDVFLKNRDFCHSIPGFACSELLSTNITRAIRGIYTTYLDEARRLLNNGDLAAAESEVRKALDYYNANQSEIRTNSEAIAVLTDIKNQEYLKYIAFGKVQLKSKNYSSAFKTLQNAESLESQYNINKSTELRDLLSQAAKPVILSDISRGLELVKQNKIEDAKKIVISSHNTQNAYNLTGDKDVSKQLDDLKKKIFTQECINAQNEYDMYLGNSRKSIVNKDFLQADKDFEMAFRVSDKYPNCMIDKTAALNLKNEVQPAIDFVKKKTAVDEDVKMNRFSSAIQSYIDLQKFYDKQQIEQNYGLSLLPMTDFISQQQNSFIIFAAGYYTNEKSYENSLKMLDVLRSKSAPAKEVKNEQTALGTQLAIRDHAINATQDYKVTVLQYTRSDKWYKNLGKAYTKQWKKIK